jgi:hypothetical protein
VQSAANLTLDGVALLPGESIVLLNVNGLPGIADPLVTDSARSVVAALGDHVVRQNALLGLVLVLPAHTN